MTGREDENYREIIDFLPDATFVINADGSVIAWNRAMEEMTGVPATAMLGKGDYEYALPFYGERKPMLANLIFMPDNEIEKRYPANRKHACCRYLYSHFPRKGCLLLGKSKPAF